MPVLSTFLSLALQTAQAAPPEGPAAPQAVAPTACDAAQAEAKAATSADLLNTLGMRCYAEKRYTEAGLLFEKAMGLDENHALANYNFACVVGLLLASQGPCDMDLSWEVALSALRRAVQADPKRAARARVDHDLDSLRAMLAFRLAVEGPPTTAQQTAKLYDGVTLWGETPGVALLAEVHFERTHETALTGTVRGWRANSLFEQVPSRGTWRVEGTALVVDWAASTSKQEEPMPASTETLRLEEMNHYGHGGWYTLPDWCSA